MLEAEAMLTIDASGQDVVGETYEMLQNHDDSVHMGGVDDNPSVSPQQDTTVDFDSLHSREQCQSSSSYVHIEEDKQPKICHPCELNGKYKATLLPSEDGIVTEKVFLNESVREQELQQEEVHPIPTVSRSVQSDSRSCITRENSVVQKLLRRCRYFDYTNGRSYIEDSAVNSPKNKLGKPCYVCGQFRHNGKKCLKRRTCCTCKRRGHIAADCPTNNKEYDICLRCGESGHELSTCNAEYSPNDLLKIQCYVCNEVGHMCCGNNTYLNPETASCYNCGESGHPGLQCPKPQLDKCGSHPPSICYKCGEAGHVARKCTKNEGISGCLTRQQASELGAEGDESWKKARRSKTFRYSKRKKKMRGLTNDMAFS